ncbi:MAG: DUF1540 domain-containing protein [Clostridia bacterium]|jgi:hypothetical protein|nr:DUF1540 domain-containing protein [Clostridia bacterium]
MERNDQQIGCEVESCRFNEQGKRCALKSICVRPAPDCSSRRENESLCGSYEHC